LGIPGDRLQRKVSSKKGGTGMKKVAKKGAKKANVKVKVKDKAAELRKGVAKIKEGSNAKIRGLELQMNRQKAEIETLKATLEKKKKDLSKVKTLASSAREMTGGLEEKENELLSLREQLGKQESVSKQLRDEVEYKNRQLATKDMDLQHYRKAAEERILQLEARVKELEGKVQGTPGSF